MGNGAMAGLRTPPPIKYSSRRYLRSAARRVWTAAVALVGVWAGSVLPRSVDHLLLCKHGARGRERMRACVCACVRMYACVRMCAYVRMYACVRVCEL